MSNSGWRGWLAKRLRTAASQVSSTKASPYLWHAQHDGVVQWSMANFQSYAEEGFNQNTLINGAIMYKVRAASQARARAMFGEVESSEYADPNHPLSKLARRPNRGQSWTALHGQTLAYLNLAGNAYWYLDRDKAERGVPSAIYPMRPDRVYIIPDGKDIKGYLYRPEAYAAADGIPILPEDIIHFKFPNPLDQFEGLGYGLAPMSSLARSGDVDNSVTKFLKLFFDSGALPAGILKFKDPLEDKDIGQIKRRWRETYGGVDNWVDVGVLDQDADYQKLGMTFDEMGFESVDERNESRILGPFGVPPILIGTRFGLKGSTYANYETARRAFWQDTMQYELQLQETEFEYLLSADDGATIRYDLSRVPALQEDITKKVDGAYKLFTMGVPNDKAFETVGLQVARTLIDGKSFVGSGVAEYGVEKEESTEESTTEPGDAEDETPETVIDEEAEKAKRWFREAKKKSTVVPLSILRRLSR